MDYTVLLKFFTALFAVMNPLSVLPIFISMTSDKERPKVKLQTLTTVVIIMFVTLFAGNQILHLFGITAGAFEAAGGIVIFLIALSMAQGKMSNMHTSPGEEQAGKTKDDPSAVPLAMPLLCGPGTIATIVVYHNYCTNMECYIGMTVIMLAVVFIVFCIFSTATKIQDMIGHTGIKIISRIMGIILASIAIEMIANGLKDILPL
jgi:multiple antibiotic resistance protein